MEEEKDTEERNIEDSNIEKNGIEESKIEDSEIEESQVEDSEIEGSVIKDSQIKDSEIRESYVEDSRIKDSKIVREEVKEEQVVGEELIRQRKQKLIGFFKKRWVWVLGILILAIILGVYIRSMPMYDHGGGIPGLWDITTNTWTLGPDLDPWLFTRYAKTIVEEGSLPEIDMMRNVPLGLDTTIETRLLPYMIVATYNFIHFFDNSINVEFAAVIFPVIMFALTIISFFLFVREIFVRKSKKSITKANIIALISSFFMIVIPAFLSRTIAGIPEKESASFFFMFLAFYLFLKAWKSESFKKAMIFGALSGIATALMGLIWGGVVYIFVTIAIASFLVFILGKVERKEILVYCSWLILTLIVLMLFSTRYPLVEVMTATTHIVSFIVFLILIIHFILWYTPISKRELFKKINLPKNIISLIIAAIFGLILISLLFGPSFLIDKIKDFNRILFNPVTGRWGVTVAENRQPYFTEWIGSFGPFIKNIPVLFWLFFLGSVVLFKNMFNKIKRKDSWILTGFYVLFFFGLVFSRYSPSNIFNGENFISKLFYFGSILLLLGTLIYYYIRYHKEQDDSFKKIDFGFLFLFSLFILCLFTARSAVRLIMVLAPIAMIFVGYLIVKSIVKFKVTKDETGKIIMGGLVILILLLSIFSFWNFYKNVKSQAYSFVPSAYNQQWQKAMQWVREETQQDAVFGHWWDYGYWVQSIGNRATVLDGGNAIIYWNYLMGRLVLTGDNQKDALEFLYNHNTTHLLIDSTDIGKYGAFSSIGSDENYDRLSWMTTFLLDEKQTQETKNQTLLVYSGGTALDEDLIIEERGKQILLPRGNAGVGGILIPGKKIGDSLEFGQPYAIIVYQGQQYNVNLRYLSLGKEFIDFGSGIEACAYLFPSIIIQGQGANSNPIGAVIYLSPRLLRGMLSQKYILNDPFNNFPNFKLVHSEQNLIVDELNKQGMALPEFVYYGGIQGPIKIWEIGYAGDEEIKQEYLDRTPSKYLSWRL